MSDIPSSDWTADITLLDTDDYVALDSLTSPDDIDLNGDGSGNGRIRRKDRADLIAATQNAQATIIDGVNQANAMMVVAKTEAEAAVQTAFLDYTARMEESTNQLEGIKTQAETDLKIAEMEMEVELAKVDADLERIRSVESVNAQANVVSAEALVVEAEAEQTEAEGEKARDLARASSDGGYSYWP